MSEKEKFGKKYCEIVGNIFDKTSTIDYLQVLIKDIDNLQSYEKEKRIKPDNYLNVLKEIVKKDIIETNKELEDYLYKITNK